MRINSKANDTPVLTMPSTQMSAASASQITAPPAPSKPTCYSISSLERQQVEVFQEFQFNVDWSQVLNHS